MNKLIKIILTIAIIGAVSAIPVKIIFGEPYGLILLIPSVITMILYSVSILIETLWTF